MIGTLVRVLFRRHPHQVPDDSPAVTRLRLQEGRIERIREMVSDLRVDSDPRPSGNFVRDRILPPYDPPQDGPS